MADHTDTDLALSRFWNGLIDAGRADAPDLDPETMALVRRIHASANAPLPGSARERVWRGLLTSYDEAVPMKEPTVLTTIDLVRPAPNGRTVPIAPPAYADAPAHANNRRLLAAIAAVLVAAIVGGIAGGLITSRLGSNEPRSGPAVFAPRTPSPDGVLSDELLAEITIPAEAVPGGDRLTSAIGVYRLEPGARDTWGPLSGSGLLLQYVISGDYWVWSDTAIQVIRAGGAAEEVAGGTETTLTAGDALLMGFTGRLAVANTGTAPVEVLSWSLFDYPVTTAGGTPVPGLIVDGDDLPWATLEPNGALTLRLRLVKLAPDAVLEAEPGSLQVGVAAPGQIGSAPSSMDGTIASVSIDGRPVVVFVVTIASASGSSATPTA